MKMTELYKRYQRGEKFKDISAWSSPPLIYKDPSELAANAPIMQQMIAKQHQNSEEKAPERHPL